MADVTLSSFEPFQHGTFDVLERVERAVLNKRPVVVEELLISHDVVDGEARVQSTLKRLDVDVEPL